MVFKELLGQERDFVRIYLVSSEANLISSFEFEKGSTPDKCMRIGAIKNLLKIWERVRLVILKLTASKNALKKVNNSMHSLILRFKRNLIGGAYKVLCMVH